MLSITALSLALFVQAAPPTTLTYAAPSRKAPPKSFKVTGWKAKDNAYVGTDLVNLRRQAKAGAPVVTKLDFGTEVTVLGHGPLVRVGKAVNRWYEVTASTAQGKVRGFLFGSTLSPFVVRADLDGDGDNEAVSVGWTSTFATRLRLFEPLAFGAHRESKARQTWGGTWKGGQVTKLAVVPAQTAGVPLVEVEVLIGDPADSYKTYWTYFYAYHPPEDGGKGPGQLVEQFGTYRNNDVDTVVEFDAKAKEGKVFFAVDGKRRKKPDVTPLRLAPAAEDFACSLDPSGLSGGPAKAKQHDDGRTKVWTRHLKKGVVAHYLQGGCEHYAQHWRFEGDVETRPKKRIAAAIALLQELGGENAENMVKTLQDAQAAFKDGLVVEGDMVPCGDASCTVSSTKGGKRSTLSITYDFAL